MGFSLYFLVISVKRKTFLPLVPLCILSPSGGCWPDIHKEGAGEQLCVRPEDGGEDLVPGG